ncbi:MAG TPA: TonB-dependent receptor [Rhizomicrobium sp.]|nr:TonB-dependent receptor [Rhizomicrobium sp.]
MRIHTHSLQAVLLAGTIAGAAATSPALAQKITKTTPSNVIEEVVVTAQKRSENIKDVPIAVTVVSGDRLMESQITSFHDLERVAPSFKSLPLGDARASTMNMRGVSSVQGNPGRQSSLGVFVDGVFMARTGMASSQDFLDIERVEVLRGPQGTLFGMNTAGGLIHIITAKPNLSEYSGRAEVVLGQYDTIEARGNITGPLIQDTLGFSLSAAKSKRGGLLYNSTLDRYVDDENKFSLRGKLGYESGNFNATLTADYARESSICCSAVFTKVTGIPKTASTVVVVPPPGYPFSRITTQSGLSTNPNAGGGVSLEMNWDYAGHTITSLSAWRRWTVSSINDPDSTEVKFLDGFLIHQEHEQVSQELRIASPGDRDLTYVAGLFFYDRWSTDYEDLHIDPSISVYKSRPDGRTIFDARVRDTSYAIFGHAEYKLTDDLAAAFGGRYTWEPQTFDFYQDSGISLYPTYGHLPTQTRNDPVFTWKLDLRYAVTADISTYASVARGFKPGGMTMTRISNVNDLQFKPESNLNYEVGFKSVLLDRRVQLNLAAFYTIYNDFQTTAFDGTRYLTTNAPEFITRGIELESEFHPLQGLALTLAGSFVDAHYTDFPNGQCTGVVGPCNLNGKRLNGSARWNLNAGLSYTVEVAEDWSAFTRFDYAWKSDVYSAQDLNPNSVSKAHGVMNARVGVTSNFGLTAEIFAKNLFDAEYTTFSYGLPFGSGGFVGYIGAPRLAGVRLSQSF